MEKKVTIIFALVALLIIITLGSFLLKDYFKKDLCGNNKCDPKETENNCPIDCKKQPITPPTPQPTQPTEEEKQFMDQTGLLLDEIRNLQKKSPDFFKDDDKDGLVNGLEREIGTDPKDSNSNGNTDTDKDGATNLQEYITGTDPKDSNSKP